MESNQSLSTLDSNKPRESSQSLLILINLFILRSADCLDAALFCKETLAFFSPCVCDFFF